MSELPTWARDASPGLAPAAGEGQSVPDMGRVRFGPCGRRSGHGSSCCLTSLVPVRGRRAHRGEKQILRAPGIIDADVSDRLGRMPGRGPSLPPGRRDILRFSPRPRRWPTGQYSAPPVCRELRIAMIDDAFVFAAGARLQLRPEDAFGNAGLMFRSHL